MMVLLAHGFGLFALLVSLTLAQYKNSTTAPSTVTSSVYSCNLYGPNNQTGTTTFTAIGGNTISLACSSYISLGKSAYYAGQSASWASESSASKASVGSAAISRHGFLVGNKTVPLYKRPSVNPTPGCNIYGPISQTGSIIVGVDRGTITTSTTVACSDYLTVQSFSALYFFTDEPWDYDRSFGRSPECTSYMDEKWEYRCYGPGWVKPDDAGDMDHYCNPPAYRHRRPRGGSYTCCGPCRFHIPSLSVFYWPTATIDTSCTPRTAAITSRASLPTSADSLQHRSVSHMMNVTSVMIIDGFTYTSPSLYIAVVGTVEVSDSCGQLGHIHTNPTVAVAPGNLLTLSYPSWRTECGTGLPANPAQAVTGTFNIADLACPTWGLSDPFTTSCWGSVYLTSTVGPPFNPLILTPTELISVDPAWASGCQYVEKSGPGHLSFGVFDPPRALSRVSGPMEGAVTLTSAQPATSPLTAEPVSVGSHTAPMATVKVAPSDALKSHSTDSSQAKVSIDPETKLSTKLSPTKPAPVDIHSSAVHEPETTAVPTSATPLSQAPIRGSTLASAKSSDMKSVENALQDSIPGSPLLSSLVVVSAIALGLSAASLQAPDPTPPATFPLASQPVSSTTLRSTESQAAEAPSQPDNYQTTVGLGAVILSMFGGLRASLAVSVDTTTASSAPTPYPTLSELDGQKSSVDPTAVSLAVTSLSQMGQEITVAGIPVSLGPSHLVIGSSTIPLAGIPQPIVTAAREASTIMKPSTIAGADTATTARVVKDTDMSGSFSSSVPSGTPVIGATSSSVASTQGPITDPSVTASSLSGSSSPSPSTTTSTESTSTARTNVYVSASYIRAIWMAVGIVLSAWKF